MTQHWVWVTGPDYYLDEDGNENPELDPDRGYSTDDWWTCHKDTRAGDLVLLYRSTVKKDVAYLIRTTTDAHPLDEAQVQEFGRGHQCGFEVLQRLPRPIPLAEMKADPVVATWPALRAAFVKSAWAVPDDVWARILELAGVTTAVLESRIVAANKVDTLEKTICRELKEKSQLLKAQGLDFKELIIEKAPGPGAGRADLIGFGRVKNPKVVIEVKKGRVGPGAVGQVVRYRDALITKYRPGRAIEGVLIGESIDRDALVLMRHLPRLRFIALADLDLDCLRA
ncbi:hypothetical protein [Actinomycetospora sp. CA-084318]|uniref:hypothetical protein n=1 Tax=Actinomycetospora sp. CA-084318 TaxID=3239892 RepID=UPI003D98BA69